MSPTSYLAAPPRANAEMPCFPAFSAPSDCTGAEEGADHRRTPGRGQADSGGLLSPRPIGAIVTRFVRWRSCMRQSKVWPLVVAGVAAGLAARCSGGGGGDVPTPVEACQADLSALLG